MQKKIILPIITISILLSCNSEKDKFKYALNTNTIENLETYIKENPKSVYLDSARFHINRLLLESATKKDNLKSFYDYLLKSKEYKVDSFIAVANMKIDSLRFDSVKTKGTGDAYSTFYKKYPESRFYSLAKQLSRDTVLIGKLFIIMTTSGHYLYTIETNKMKYDISGDKNTEYINIEKAGEHSYVMASGEMHEVGGRISSSKEFDKLHTSDQTIKANYIKRLKK